MQGNPEQFRTTDHPVVRRFLDFARGASSS
jgi:hypothetical protein